MHLSRPKVSLLCAMLLTVCLGFLLGCGGPRGYARFCGCGIGFLFRGVMVPSAAQSKYYMDHDAIQEHQCNAKAEFDVNRTIGASVLMCA